MISQLLSTFVVFRRCSANADRALIHPKERTLVRTLLLCGRDAPEPRQMHAMTCTLAIHIFGTRTLFFAVRATNADEWRSLLFNVCRSQNLQDRDSEGQWPLMACLRHPRASIGNISGGYCTDLLITTTIGVRGKSGTSWCRCLTTTQDIIWRGG